MGIDPSALTFGLKDFVKMTYGPTVTHVFPDVQVKAYRHSVLDVSLVSVVDCLELNWVKQQELSRMVSDDRLFRRIPNPGWMLMDFNNSRKHRISGEDNSNVQLNPKLWILRPIFKGTMDAHVKEHQEPWLVGSSPLPDLCPQYPLIRRMLLGVTSPALAPRIGAA